ncbi:MAG: PilN domain-containing protein [Thermodesulfobacteriota bacterium]
MIERINLLPDELKSVGRKSHIRRLLVLFVVICIVGLSLSYVHQRRLVKGVEDVIASLTNRKEALLLESAEHQRLVDKINLTKKKEREIRDRMDVIGSLVRSRIYWSEVIRKMTFLVPEELWFKSITSYDIPDSPSRLKKGIKFTGTAFSNPKIAEFIFALENSTILENVFLSYSKKRVYMGRDLFDFELTANLKSQGL